VTRGTRANNPLGTCAPRAIQRTAREDAYGIVILDLTGLPRGLPAPPPFIRGAFYPGQIWVFKCDVCRVSRPRVCFEKKKKATDTLPSDTISSVFDGSIMSVYLRNRRPPFDNVVVFTNESLHFRRYQIRFMCGSVKF